MPPDSGVPSGQSTRAGYSGLGLYPEESALGHLTVQAGMSDDGLPYYRCRQCGWSRVGSRPDPFDGPCKGGTDELILTLVIDGEPQPQGSISAYVVYESRKGPDRWKWRAARRADGSYIVNLTSDNADLKAWRTKIEASARAAFERAGDDGSGAGYTVEVVSFFERPKAHFRTGRNAGLVRDGAPARPIVRPDVDKLLRATLDGIGAVVWANDSQVTDTVSRKRYTLGSARQEIRVFRNAQQTALDLPAAETGVPALDDAGQLTLA